MPPLGQTPIYFPQQRQFHFATLTSTRTLSPVLNFLYTSKNKNTSREEEEEKKELKQMALLIALVALISRKHLGFFAFPLLFSFTSFSLFIHSCAIPTLTKRIYKHTHTEWNERRMSEKNVNKRIEHKSTMGVVDSCEE